MAGDGMHIDAQMFLIENVAVANLLIDAVVSDLEAGLSEEDAHVKLLDHCYTAEDQGVTVAAFQNLAATAVLLVALERKKK